MLISDLKPSIRIAVCVTIVTLAMAVAIMVGGVVLAGTIIATCLVGSAVFTLSRLPGWCRKPLLRYPLITNLVATAITASLVGTATATGLVACVITFLFVDLVQETAKAAFAMRGASVELTAAAC